MLAARGNHYSQDSAAAEGTMQQADYRVWQVDHLQLSTTSPCSFPYNPHPGFNWDMTDFRVKGEGLRWDFIIPTTWHSDCFGFPFELPFVCCFNKT